MSDIKKPSPTASPQEQSDAEFDAFLREDHSRIETLYRKLPQPEPDAPLDARVRAQARRALRDTGNKAQRQAHSTPQSGTPHARRWLPAFGAAATLALAAGLAWRLMPPAAPFHEAISGADTAASPAGESGRAAHAPASTDTPRAADTSASYKHKSHRSTAEKAESSVADDPAEIEAKSAASGTVGAAPKAAAPASAAETVEPNEFSPRKAEPLREKSAPPPITSAAPSPTARETDRIVATQSFANDAAARSPIAVMSDPSMPAHYRWEVADGASAAPVRGVYPPDDPPPNVWVEVVRAMLHDGHRKEAKMALSDLRDNYPYFSLPPDLRDLE